MVRHHLKLVCLASALGVPFFTLLAPSWVSLMGVGPSWAVLWLLPWSLVAGPISGGFAGFSLGLILDAISLGHGTQVPVLLVLGFWWGRLGRRGLPIERSFNLGLLSWIGCVLLGMSLWLQALQTQISSSITLFNSWSLHTILCEAIITSLLAPLACSWLLLVFRGNKTSF